jgi:hypothetical protein
MFVRLSDEDQDVGTVVTGAARNSTGQLDSISRMKAACFKLSIGHIGIEI